MTNSAIITGISGYIGSNLARYLSQLGWQVAGIIPENADLTLVADIEKNLRLFVYQGDVFALKEFLHEYDRETNNSVIFHLASCFIAEHQPEQVTDLINSNVLFGTHLLEAMYLAEIRTLINTGTSWQHYDNCDYNPVCLYAATKEAFNKVVKFYVEARKFRVITLELFDTYGKKDPRNKIINLFSRIAKTNEQLLMSPGEQELDLVYIDDVVAAYECAHKQLLSCEEVDTTYGVATKCPMSLKDIALLYEKVFAVKLNISWGTKPYRAREVMKVWSKGKVLPGWQAKYLLEDGLRKLKEV